MNMSDIRAMEALQQIEPTAASGGDFPTLDRSALSIAISLKRIADSVAAGPPIADAIRDAIFAAQGRSR